MPILDDSKKGRAKKEHRLDKDFTRAMQKGLWEELKGFILRRSARLLPFNEVKDKMEIWFVRNLGIQNVSIDSIGNCIRFGTPILSRMVTTGSQWPGQRGLKMLKLDPTNMDAMFPWIGEGTWKS
jgi:hypothetical protein